MKKELLWEVTENGGGGLGLYVWDNDVLIFAHNGYEYNPGQLTEDVNNLLTDNSVSAWDGNEIIDEDIVRAVRNNVYELEDTSLIFDANGNIIPLTTDEYYDDQSETKTIHGSAGIADYEDMGRAGQEEFYPTRTD